MRATDAVIRKVGQIWVARQVAFEPSPQVHLGCEGADTSHARRWLPIGGSSAQVALAACTTRPDDWGSHLPPVGVLPSRVISIGFPNDMHRSTPWRAPWIRSWAVTDQIREFMHFPCMCWQAPWIRSRAVNGFVNPTRLGEPCPVEVLPSRDIQGSPLPFFSPSTALLAVVCLAGCCWCTKTRLFAELECLCGGCFAHPNSKHVFRVELYSNACWFCTLYSFAFINGVA